MQMAGDKELINREDLEREFSQLNFEGTQNISLSKSQHEITLSKGNDKRLNSVRPTFNVDNS